MPGPRGACSHEVHEKAHALVQCYGATLPCFCCCPAHIMCDIAAITCGRTLMALAHLYGKTMLSFQNKWAVQNSVLTCGQLPGHAHAFDHRTYFGSVSMHFQTASKD